MIEAVVLLCVSTERQLTSADFMFLTPSPLPPFLHTLAHHAQHAPCSPPHPTPRMWTTNMWGGNPSY